MKIKELIKRLQKHPNQETDINIYLNVINTDFDECDEEAELEIFNEDCFNEDSLDIIVYPKTLKDDADIEYSIQDFLEVNDEINININLTKGILVTDKSGGVLREIDTTRDLTEFDVSRKLRKML